MLERIQAGQVDPSLVITHRMLLDAAPDGYEIILDTQDECIKVLLTP